MEELRGYGRGFTAHRDSYVIVVFFCCIVGSVIRSVGVGHFFSVVHLSIETWRWMGVPLGLVIIIIIIIIIKWAVNPYISVYSMQWLN